MIFLISYIKLATGIYFWVLVQMSSNWGLGVLYGRATKNYETIEMVLLPKLFWPTVRKNCSSDWEKLLIFEAEGQEFAKFSRSLEKFIKTVTDQNNFW